MEKLTLPLTTFLKLCASSPRARISVLKQYLRPGGYDFHKAMKRIARKLIRDEITFAEAEAQIAKIKQEPERRLTREAILVLDHWRKTVDGEWKAPPRSSYKSMSGLLTVKLEPEIAFQREGQPMSILCLWNLVRPDLKPDFAAQGLHLLRQVLGTAQNQFGIYNLRTNNIFTEAVFKPNTGVRLERDLLVLEALWIDCQDDQMSTDDMVSHVATLKLPPHPPSAP